MYTKGRFKNVSFKSLDSDASNYLQNPDGEIKASALFFALGEDESTIGYPDSDVYTNSSTSLFTPLPLDYRPGNLNSTFLSAVVGSGILSPYLEDSSPDNTPYGDLDGTGNFNVSDVNVLGRLASTPPSTTISASMDERFGYYFGKDGATKMPGLNSDIRMSMFKGIYRHYGTEATQNTTQDADGFGYRVKLTPLTSGSSITVLVVANPYHNTNTGIVETFTINDDGALTHLASITGPSTNSYFGYAIDADDGYIIVGAPFYTTNDGRAYVYNTVGTLQNTFTAPTSNVFFGSTVAIDAKRDRVAIADQTIQYSNNATYGYQIGKVELSRFKSSTTQIAYFNNPDPRNISFGTSSNNVWLFGCNAFNSASAGFDDGTINTFTAGLLQFGAPGEGVTTRGMQNLTFGGSRLYVGSPGGNVLNNLGAVYSFNSSDGSYLGSMRPTISQAGSFGVATSADSDGIIIGAHWHSLYGGLVYYRTSGLNTRDQIAFNEINTLQDWGFSDTTNSANIGKFVAKSKRHIAIWGKGPNNGPSASDDWIGIFPNDGSSSFNSITKAFTSTAIKNTNGNFVTLSAAIRDVDVFYNETSGKSYLAAGLPTADVGNTYDGIAVVYDLDDAIQDITVTGEEPTA